jgi:hypothetical protein
MATFEFIESIHSLFRPFEKLYARFSKYRAGQDLSKTMIL